MPVRSILGKSERGRRCRWRDPLLVDVKLVVLLDCGNGSLKNGAVDRCLISVM